MRRYAMSIQQVYREKAEMPAAERATLRNALVGLESTCTNGSSQTVQDIEVGEVLLVGVGIGSAIGRHVQPFQKIGADIV